LAAIRKHFCNARVEIIGYPSYLEIVNGRFYADATSRFDQAEFSTLFTNTPNYTELLLEKFGNADIVIPFVVDKEKVLLNNLAALGAKNIVQYDPFPSPEGNVHIIDHFLRLLDKFEIKYLDKIPKVYFNDEDTLFSDNFIKSNIKNSEKVSVAIHPGSGSKQKCWPIEYFADLITWLRDEMRANVFVVSGPADYKIVERLKLKLKGSFFIVENLALPHLAAVIKRCNLFIGNDSGITHLAAAVGVPTIAIFGPTNPVIWGPRGKMVKIIYKELQCNPCEEVERVNCVSKDCFINITVEDVIGEVKQVLNWYK